MTTTWVSNVDFRETPLIIEDIASPPSPDVVVENAVLQSCSCTLIPPLKFSSDLFGDEGANKGCLVHAGFIMRVSARCSMTKAPARPTEPKTFFELLCNYCFGESFVVESFDASSLHAIFQNEALKGFAIWNCGLYVRSINASALSKPRMVDSRSACICSSIFRWSGSYYSQKR